MNPILESKDYAYQYSGREEWALSGVSLSVARGECICLCGPSGCGKSTLLLALKGLLKGGRQKGVLRFSEDHRSHAIGLVFQNAENHLLCTTVADEVAFGPQNLGFTPLEIETAVRKSLDAVALAGFDTRNVENLSAGQTHRLAIASVLSSAPKVLFLDEPTAQLDADGKDRLAELLGRLKSAGHTLLIADHELGPFEPLADRFILMDRGRIERVDGKIPDEFTLSVPRCHRDEPFRSTKKRTSLISVEGAFSLR